MVRLMGIEATGGGCQLDLYINPKDRWEHSPYYILKAKSLPPSAPSGAAGLSWLALRSYASLA